MYNQNYQKINYLKLIGKSTKVCYVQNTIQM